MAIGGSLSPGGSYGRIQVILNWIQDNWVYFDGWCCAKNIDPITLPAYRLYNVAVLSLKEYLIDPDPDVTAKQLANLEEILISCDDIKHPLLELSKANKKTVIVSRSTPTTESAPPPPETRHKYIPP